MTRDIDFKYDVAFSFLAKDEPLAASLNEGLKDWMSTFLYSEQQKVLAGTDGESTFKSVFRDEARTVVVLYRQGWGETPWTRMEQDAIRERAYDEGYDFVLFVKLDDSKNLPDWLPRTRLYIGYERYGPQGAMAVIEERAALAGGRIAPDTVQSLAAQRRGSESWMPTESSCWALQLEWQMRKRS